MKNHKIYQWIALLALWPPGTIALTLVGIFLGAKLLRVFGFGQEAIDLVLAIAIIGWSFYLVKRSLPVTKETSKVAKLFFGLGLVFLAFQIWHQHKYGYVTYPGRLDHSHHDWTKEPMDMLYASVFVAVLVPSIALFTESYSKKFGRTGNI